jgi:uncharacterized protein YndB with AHSA1/START domain
MMTVATSMLIHAPVEKVFAYLEDPIHIPEISPHVRHIKDVRRQPNGAPTFRAVMNVAGVRLAAVIETTDYVPNACFVQETKRGVKSISRWSVQQEGDGTRVTMEGTFIVSIPWLGRVVEAIASGPNQDQVEQALANLKAKMEGRWSPHVSPGQGPPE